jgi:large subunit ribosomal protein L30
MPRTFVWHPSRGPAKTAAFKFKDGDQVVIKQVKSGIGHEARMRRTLEAMGLRHHQAVVERQVTPALRGQIKHVRHLVEVTAAGSSDAPKSEARTSAAPKRKTAAKKTAAKAAKE